MISWTVDPMFAADGITGVEPGLADRRQHNGG